MIYPLCLSKKMMKFRIFTFDAFVRNISVLVSAITGITTNVVVGSKCALALSLAPYL